MKKILINEGQYKILNEYHHAYDNGLQNDAVEIANEVCELVKKGWTKYMQMQFDSDYKLSSPYTYTLKCFGESKKLYVYAWNEPEACAYVYPNKLYIGTQVINDSLENGNKEYLVQSIYHELGHLTNGVYGGYSQGNRDFKKPTFFKIKNDKLYQKITKCLYRFLSRELKARCFETTMFLKNNMNRNITIQDVYDNRCSDISMMRRFVKTLKRISSLGESGDTMNIINELYKNCINNYKNPSWDNKCKKVILYFENKLQWFKKRIDKIYYDYKTNYENFS